jgi:predicted deacetylase
VIEVSPAGLLVVVAFPAVACLMVGVVVGFRAGAWWRRGEADGWRVVAEAAVGRVRELQGLQDRWVSARRRRAVEEATQALDAMEAAAGRRLADQTETWLRGLPPPQRDRRDRGES